MLNSKYALIFYEAQAIRDRWAGLDTKLGLQVRFDGRWIAEERYYRYGLITKVDAKLGLFQTRKRDNPDEEMLAVSTLQLLLWAHDHPTATCALLKPIGFSEETLRVYFDQLPERITICPT